MEGSGVAALQNDLKKLGYFSGDCTGYYGDLTEAAVKKLQSRYGYTQDGIAGKNTFTLIDKLLGRKGTTASRSISREDNYMVDWFGGVDRIFTRGKVAAVYDIDTGLSFQVKRTYGTNHADSETLTVNDTNILKTGNTGTEGSLDGSDTVVVSSIFSNIWIYALRLKPAVLREEVCMIEGTNKTENKHSDILIETIRRASGNMSFDDYAHATGLEKEFIFRILKGEIEEVDEETLKKLSLVH